MVKGNGAVKAKAASKSREPRARKVVEEEKLRSRTKTMT
jgi:hypothetical protein